MSILKYDLTNLTRGYLAHGVNCQGVMGAGLAKALAQKYPNLLKFWNSICSEVNIVGDKMVQPGACYPFEVSPTLTIYNLTTQEFYGSRGRASLQWVSEAVSDLERCHTSLDPIFIPPIATGLGGLVWGDVREILHASTLSFIVCDL